VSGNKIVIILIIIFLTGTVIVAEEEIKLPNVSGAFYPANKIILSTQINSFLNKARIPEISQNPVALISPHAGYVYSGAVAAYGYKAIKGRHYKTVVVIAPSHFADFQGFSVWKEGKFKTPLGDIEVDSEFSNRLINATNKIKYLPNVFEKEHSLEVQLPFLQKVLKNFKIVPVIVSPRASLEDCKDFASILNDTTGNRSDVLVIASTDLSHYRSGKDADKIDAKTISCIKDMDLNSLWVKSSLKEVELCGLRPVEITIFYAKLRNATNIKILKHANSGDASGDYKRVVGYLSAVFLKAAVEGEKDMLNNIQKKQLLGIARESLESYVRSKKRTNPQTQDDKLKQKTGAFVTLHKNGQLRGCIGRIVGDTPLYQVVADYAVEAAVNDPRFPEVKSGELKEIDLEISAMTPLKKISDVNIIEVGKHGILMRKGFYSGLLLPQVATEYGWDRETFLGHTCQKAGLPTDCWKDKSTQVFIFSAEVFSEDSIKE